ncbi:MAG: hypothetical protein LUG93_05575 [Lachnospiraceae bacterium]|nr:hypothetical protein [Lachnospiraceae bacterium]
MKMKNGSMVCEISVASDASYVSYVPCDYQRDTISYAVKRFFARCGKLCRECTFESWQIRIGKKRKKSQHFCYLIPALLMELPGEWVRVTGVIDEKGVEVRKIELFPDYPLPLAV